MMAFRRWLLLKMSQLGFIAGGIAGFLNVVSVRRDAVPLHAR